MPDGRIFTMYLSTLTPNGYSLVPADTSNKASIKWNIDWTKLFGPLAGNADCLVRIRLISRQKTVSTLPYDTNLGTVRCSFTTAYQQLNSSVIVGTLNVVQFSGNVNNALSCDTSMTEGVRIRVPNSAGIFFVNLVGLNESLLDPTNTPDYQIQFDFEIVEDSVME